MSRNQNAQQNHNIKLTNNSFESVENFGYLWMAATDRNYIHKEIRSRLQSGDTHYHSVPNLLSSSLLSKNERL